eukprot:TRINITY_DN89_c0_g2_i1.p1 TRINITY_DN89_c0_g2~~TRINITY_DN89_c0_g2_i1.p1  ORF type:complete len:414 (+),score=-1.03 TRINITY_DN89_c0_g2_i1:352-1593(+)
MAPSAVDVAQVEAAANGSEIDLRAYRGSQRSDNPACVLAIGTANPPYVVEQKDYPDYYFKVCRAEHLTELKEKFRRICDKSKIGRRHFWLTEELLNKYPCLSSYDEPSLDARQEIMVPAVPALGQMAAEKAIAEWGQPMSKITHLIFCSTAGVEMPGSDYKLIRAMGLNPNVKRVMLYHQGCMAGGTVMRIAKDLAENNRGARVMIVCSEVTVITYRGPKPDGGHIDNLAGQALFGDGSAAVIVGADPIPGVERPWFQLLWTAETLLPDSHGSIEGHLYERGLTFHLMKKVPEVISSNVEKALQEAFSQFNVGDWNKLFWIAHPGGPAILDAVEATLGLDAKKLRATRHVLWEYGNMSSACVLFIMDEVRKYSVANGCSTTGEGLDFGVLFGFGPGLSVETVALKAIPLTEQH